MDAEEQTWNQYLVLRDEIQSAGTSNNKVLGIIVGAVAAILAAAFSQEEPLTRSLMLLASYIVTIYGYRILQGNRRIIWRISTYMRIFLEPRLAHVKWETRLNKQSEQYDAGRYRALVSSLIGTSEAGIISSLNILIGAALVFSGVLQLEESSLHRLMPHFRAILIGAVIVFNVVLVAYAVRKEKNLRRLGTMEQEYLRSWIRVRDAERNVVGGKRGAG